MSNRIGKLGYNPKNDRYGILEPVMDFWFDDGLHCGYTFEVYDDDKKIWIDDRIEYNGDEWYLIFSHKRGKQLEGLTVRF